jgi:hypothetical protein
MSLQRATLSGQRVPPQLGNLTNDGQNPGIRCAVNVTTRVICDEPTASKRGNSGGRDRVTSRPLFGTTSRVRKGQTIGAICRLERLHVRGRRGSSPTRRAKLKRQEQYALAEPGCCRVASSAPWPYYYRVCNQSQEREGWGWFAPIIAASGDRLPPTLPAPCMALHPDVGPALVQG